MSESFVNRALNKVFDVMLIYDSDFLYKITIMRKNVF